MQAQKISISLTKPMYDFIENYQEKYCCKSRSEVINKALYLLQQAQLENCYREANKEIDNEFEKTALDGLEHETW
jgi:antitoxin ParD1/3/4